ncbi:MAG TPA: SDR family oxidoreductase [Jatrophihabitantaceae bacterium]|jgi:short-subunit dehydrogenase|nr:SDR family oxidoreductase [Jatrophihabitantaceae bacterium]
MPTALVTGATAGLGAEFARHLAAKGLDLVLVARDRTRLESTKIDLQGRRGISVETISADLATVDGCGDVAARILDPERPVELLVNNAGLGLYRAFGKADLADEDRMLDVNVRAVMHLSHAAVQAMRPRGRGMIVNVASVSGFVPRPETVSYGAGKAYVIAFTEGLAQLLAGTGVTATVVCPGFTRTEFHQRAQVDMSYLPGWMWLDAAKVVAEGMADARRGKAVSVPDVRYKAIVGASRVAPRGLIRRLGAAGKPRPR